MKRKYDEKEKKQSLTVIYPVSHLRVSSMTLAYPRVPFTVGYIYTVKNKNYWGESR